MMIATMTTPSSSITTSSRRIPTLFLALPNCHNQPFSPPLIRKKFTFSSSTNKLKQLLEHHHHHHHPLSHISHRHLQEKKPTTSIIIIKASSSSMESSAASSAESQAKPFSVLFVCWGNICRSPAAEGVFRDLVKKSDLDSNFKIDSAGTINYHEGNLADPRMRAASKKRGIEITSISRPIRPSDFRDFDIILAMDKQNREDILEAFNRWKFREPLPDDAHKKVKLMCSYCKKHDETEVPDPYYGGPQGFEKVLDLLQDACESLLDSILAENSG